MFGIEDNRFLLWVINIWEFTCTDHLTEGSEVFLSFSRNTRQINFVIYNESEKEIWNNSMNECLGGTFEETDNSRLIKEFQFRLKNIIKVSPTSVYNIELSNELELLDLELSSKEVYIHRFGTSGRKIAEIITKDICSDLSIKASSNVYDNIEKIEKSKRVAKWINSYLHNLRILGNESVHVMERNYRVPEQLSQSDLLVIFSNIIRVIEFYFSWKENYVDKL